MASNLRDKAEQCFKACEVAANCHRENEAEATECCIAAIHAALVECCEAERERCAQAVEAVFGKAHTRASENADIYDAQDDAIERAAAAIRALRQQGVEHG